MQDYNQLKTITGGYFPTWPFVTFHVEIQSLIDLVQNSTDNPK